MTIPNVIEKTAHGPHTTDLFSSLHRNRIVFLNGEVNDATAWLVVSQLLHLESEDPKSGIQLFINSPGGSVHSGLAIFDTMRYIRCDVTTICVGMAASMGAFLLAAGTKGKRCALPTAEIMIHQPSGGTYGQASDIEIQAKQILTTRKKLDTLLAEMTGKTYKQMVAHTDRDKFMSAQEALEYGIIDMVIEKH
jgi:ATP-dependent Clp protease protease subunit